MCCVCGFWLKCLNIFCRSKDIVRQCFRRSICQHDTFHYGHCTVIFLHQSKIKVYWRKQKRMDEPDAQHNCTHFNEDVWRTQKMTHQKTSCFYSPCKWLLGKRWTFFCGCECVLLSYMNMLQSLFADGTCFCLITCGKYHRPVTRSLLILLQTKFDKNIFDTSKLHMRTVNECCILLLKLKYS